MILFLQKIDNSHLVFTTVVAISTALLISGFLESKILNTIGWTDKAKAVGFVAATNMITPVLGFVFLVIAFLVFSAFGVQSYTDFQEQVILKIFVYLLFPIFIVFLRVQMLKALKIKTGATAWLYAVASTKITFWFLAVFIYIFYEIFKK